jgi:methylmalonyl-CoA decarboxylase
MALIDVALERGIGTITFHHAEKRNALSNALLQEMGDSLDRLTDMRARVVVLRAQPGSKVWSAGFDVDELPIPGRDPLSYNDPLEILIRKIQTMPAPAIAMIEGSVWGGACDLTFICDLVIGCETASFAMTPAKLGVPYNISGILHFINIVGPRIAREMFFTAAPVDARRALDVGILSHLVPVADLERRTYELAEQIAANSPLSIAVIKDPGEQLPAPARDLRAGPGAAAQGLRQPGLRRRAKGLPGEAAAGLHGVLRGGATGPRSSRAMTIRCTSLVPSPISVSLASRKARSTGNSLV